MSRRTKIVTWVGVVTLGVTAVGFFFCEEIRIAYHRNRMFAAMENHTLLNPNSANLGSRRVTAWENMRFSLFGMSLNTEAEAVRHHEQVLLELGHLAKREFWLTNRIIRGDSNAWPAMLRQITNTFDASHWWSANFPETNGFTVTATPEDMPKWEKLLSDFDQSPR